MDTQRRRAHDFTDSLNSFRQTVNKDKSNQVFLEDSLDSRNKQGYDKYNCSENNTSCTESVILAGSSTNQQFISNTCNTAEKSYNTAYKNIHPLLRDDTLIVSDETSYLSMKPDLNKCINLFNNEYLNNSSKEQLSPTLSETIVNKDIISRHLNKYKSMEQQDRNNRPRSMSAESLRNIILLNQELKRSKSYTVLDKPLKRDTNYNIKSEVYFPVKIAVKTGHNEKVETIVPSFETLLSKPSALLYRKDNSTKDDQHDSMNSEMSSKDELNPSELKTLLQSLTDQKPLKETAVQQRLLRRLSVNYDDAPKVFTEGLLTIIEESVINNHSYVHSQYPEISLLRFNEELRKMRKFLEDETVPEWPESPGMSTPICTKRKSQEPNDLLQKSLGALSPDKSLNFTSVSPRCNIKSPKKAYRRISKNTSYITKNLLNDTNTFESLEAMCKQLFPDNTSTPTREKNLLQSPLQNMSNILRTCESQMASLEDSPNIHEQMKKAGTCISNSAYQHNKILAQNQQYRLLSNEKYDRMDSETVADTLKQTEYDKHQKMIELDDFENTLMYEIAKKRQRCLDTAKVMIEIDTNFESEEIDPNINESSPNKINDKFIKTLMNVKKYQDYLEKYKSFLNLFHQTRLYSSRDRKDVQVKEKSNKDFNTCMSVTLGDKPTLQIPKLTPRKKSISPSSRKPRSTNKTVALKPRLFITPGKTPVDKSCKPKRTYFPNLLPGTNKQDKHISPHAKTIYRQIGSYDHVVSPVGMYIRGTDSHLTKNLRSKTDRTSVTPKIKQTSQLLNPKMKLQSSPKPKEKLTGITVGDENVADNFLHPEMHYKYPSYSRIIEKTENRKEGNYVTE